MKTKTSPPPITETVVKLLDIANESGTFYGNVNHILGESLYYTFNAIITCYRDGAKMELGVNGLPKPTRKPVDLGVLYIDRGIVRLHPELKTKVEEITQRQDSLLAKLKIKQNKHLKT